MFFCWCENFKVSLSLCFLNAIDKTKLIIKRYTSKITYEDFKAYNLQYKSFHPFLPAHLASEEGRQKNSLIQFHSFKPFYKQCESFPKLKTQS